MKDLLEQNVTSVYRFALRLAAGDAATADDLTQETMLRAWNKRTTFDAISNPRLWLLRITANIWRDQLRHQQVRRRWLQDTANHPQPAGGAPGHQDEAARLLAQLDRLPPRQREVLYLNVCEELSITHVAAVLGIGEGAVKSSLALARQRLRELAAQEHLA